MQRLDRAFDLYQTGAVDYILVSGGGQPSEAVDRILIETQSCSTEQNITNSKVLLAKAGLPGPVLLVTHRLKRAAPA